MKQMYAETKRTGGIVVKIPAGERAIGGRESEDAGATG
jgi:hypothetical protein